MAKLTLTSEVKSLEINDKNYPIAERTGALEKRLIDEHDSKLDELTEYQRYKTLITLLLGEEAFTELFPLGEDESLNTMAMIAYHAQKEFNAEALAIEKQRMEDMTTDLFGDMDAVRAKFAGLNKEVESLARKAEVTSKKRKK